MAAKAVRASRSGSATCPAVNSARGYRLPGQSMIIDVLNGIVGLIFPGCLSNEEAPAFVGHLDGVRDTGRVAQDLYEQGAITYMRTDGVQMDGSAISAARRAIADRFDGGYVGLRDRAGLITHARIAAFDAAHPDAVELAWYPDGPEEASR